MLPPRARHMILTLLALALSPGAVAAELPPVEIVADVPAGLPRVTRIEPLTAGPGHHFVGYYGIIPWDASGTRLTCLEATFGDRLVAAGDRAAVCLVDPTSGTLNRIAETAAWNLQQGAMLHWLPTAPEREVIYNDRADGKLVSVILDVETGRRRTIDRPVYAVSPDGRRAVSVNFDRLRRIRPVTGYAGGDAGMQLVNRPADDGLFHVDLATGASRLLVSVDAACRAAEPPDAVRDQPLWLEHALFSRGDGGRVFLMARAFDPATRKLVSAPMVVNADGTGLRPLMPWALQGASHYDWLDDRRLVLTRSHGPAPTDWHHLLIDTADPEAKPRVLAPGVLTRDGHCTVSPDGRWMVTDSYPDERRRQHLFVVDLHAGRAARLASLHAPPEYKGDWRCDLHPRWSRDSRRVCVDSTHEGVRQVYVVELDVPEP
jgi:hypothetical protein